LQQRLANEILLAYQYTIGDQVYQVGEFGDGVDATVVTGTLLKQSYQSLILKMLKSNLTNVKTSLEFDDEKHLPNSGAYQVKQEDFRFNILYTDPCL
jgi:cell surface protein SprA